MKIPIYDYDNKKQEVDLPISDIDEIDYVIVGVFSGDETGTVVLKNGKEIHFDANDCRWYDFHDGGYLVQGKEQIEKWINYVCFDMTKRASYERRDLFFDYRNQGKIAGLALQSLMKKIQI